MIHNTANNETRRNEVSEAHRPNLSSASFAVIERERDGLTAVSSRSLLFRAIIISLPPLAINTHCTAFTS